MDGKIVQSKILPILLHVLRWTKLDQLSSQQRARRFFVTGILMWFAVQGMLIVRPLSMRDQFPRMDDAYVYINKSPQMASCFRQDCPALEDLRAHLTVPASEHNAAWERYRAYTRTFVVYHPLYSVLLLGLTQVVPDIETAYKMIWYIAPFLFGVVFALWVRVLWGEGPAGIAMSILAFYPFTGQGLHYVVPSNLTMAVAVLLWTRIVAKQGKAPWTLVLGTLFLIAMHPIGRIYAVIAALIVVCIRGVPRSLRAWVPFLAVFGSVGVAFVLPHVIQRPEMGFQAGPLPPGFPKTAMIPLMISAIFKGVMPWIQTVGGMAVAFAAIGYGFWTVDPLRRSTLVKIMLLLLVFLVLSLFYVWPRQPADTFIRMIIPFAFLCTGAIGQALWHLLHKAGAFLKQPAQEYAHAEQNATTVWELWSHRPVTRANIVLLIVIVVVGFALDVVIINRERLIRTSEQLLENHSLYLNLEQPALLHTQANQQDRVLYTELAPMLFYLSHGAMDHGAIYYPALQGTPEEEQWLQRPDVRFAVLWDPVEALTLDEPLFELGLIQRDGTIATAPLRSMHIETSTMMPGNTLKLFVVNHGRATHIDMVALEALSYDTYDAPVSASTRVAIPAQWEGWVSADFRTHIESTMFQVRFPTGMRHLFVGGMAFGDTSLQWPWEQKATLTLLQRQRTNLEFTYNQRITPALIIHFDPAVILPAPLNTKEVQVLDDTGSTVLMRIGE